MWASNVRKQMSRINSGMDEASAIEMSQFWMDTGLLECAIHMLRRHTEKKWLETGHTTALRADVLLIFIWAGQNGFMPYHLASILGSIVHSAQPYIDTKRMTDAGALHVLMPMISGSLCWAEQYIAARALAHVLGPRPTTLGEEHYVVHTALEIGAAPVLANLAVTIDDVVITNTIVRPSRSFWRLDDIVCSDLVLKQSARSACRHRYMSLIGAARDAALLGLRRLARWGHGSPANHEVAAPGVLASMVQLLLRNAGTNDFSASGGRDYLLDVLRTIEVA